MCMCVCVCVLVSVCVTWKCNRFFWLFILRCSQKANFCVIFSMDDKQSRILILYLGSTSWFPGGCSWTLGDVIVLYTVFAGNPLTRTVHEVSRPKLACVINNQPRSDFDSLLKKKEVILLCLGQRTVHQNKLIVSPVLLTACITTKCMVFPIRHHPRSTHAWLCRNTCIATAPCAMIHDWCIRLPFRTSPVKDVG